jgi:hypothetical protein
MARLSDSVRSGPPLSAGGPPSAGGQIAMCPAEASPGRAYRMMPRTGRAIGAARGRSPQMPSRSRSARLPMSRQPRCPSSPTGRHRLSRPGQPGRSSSSTRRSHTTHRTCPTPPMSAKCLTAFHGGPDRRILSAQVPHKVVWRALATRWDPPSGAGSTSPCDERRHLLIEPLQIVQVLPEGDRGRLGQPVPGYAEPFELSEPLE